MAEFIFLALTYFVALDVSFSCVSRQASTTHYSERKFIMNLASSVSCTWLIDETWISAGAEAIFNDTCMLTWTFSIFSTTWIWLRY